MSQPPSDRVQRGKEVSEFRRLRAEAYCRIRLMPSSATNSRKLCLTYIDIAQRVMGFLNNWRDGRTIVSPHLSDHGWLGRVFAQYESGREPRGCSACRIHVVVTSTT